MSKWNVVILQLFETSVIIRCRNQDKGLVESVFPALAAEYKNSIGKDIVLKIDNETFLPPGTTGGIDLLIQNSKIKITNTLEARLELIAQQLVPEIRTALFGRNSNRKFTD